MGLLLAFSGFAMAETESLLNSLFELQVILMLYVASWDYGIMGNGDSK